MLFVAKIFFFNFVQIICLAHILFLKIFIMQFIKFIETICAHYNNNYY